MELPEFRGVASPKTPELIDAAASQVLSRFRSAAAQRQPPLGIDAAQIVLDQRVPEPDLFEVVADDETRDEIAKAIDQLPEREKLVIALYDYENLTLREIGDVLGLSAGRVGNMRRSALRTLSARLTIERGGATPQPVVIGPDGEPLSADSPERLELQLRVARVEDELIELLLKDPSLFYKLPPRRFEELVAELYARRGFTATLTPASGDGGADVFVTRNDELGSSLSVIQCKRYAPNQKVGVGVVRELQGTIMGAGATAGVVLTTSFFTKGARELEKRFKYQLSLQDFYSLDALLRLPPVADLQRSSGGDPPSARR